MKQIQNQGIHDPSEHTHQQQEHCFVLLYMKKRQVIELSL